MAGKRSTIVCSRCKQTGFLNKRWIKRTVNIPKIPKPDNVISISPAWDYAAKICLRMRENMILWPSQSSIDREDISPYQLFSKFSPLTADQIKAFEQRHLSTPARNVKRRIRELRSNKVKTTEVRADGDQPLNQLPLTDTIHTLLPNNAGHITKSSIAWLYGAIISLVLRDISQNFLLPNNIIREFALAIYTYFSLYVNMVDNRYSTDLLDLFRILQGVKDGSGHHAASSASSTDTILCKNCSKNVRKDPSNFVQMEFSIELQKWKCPRCGGVDRLKSRALTPKYIRNIQHKVLQKEKDLLTYLPLFDKVENMYNYIINKNTKDILKRFEEYESIATKDLLSKKEGYFIVHYDSSKKWKKRSCYIPYSKLAHVQINDSRYFSEYKPLIDEFAGSVNRSTESEDERRLLHSIYNKLKEIGWPERYLKDKIKADVYHQKFSSF